MMQNLKLADTVTQKLSSWKELNPNEELILNKQYRPQESTKINFNAIWQKSEENLAPCDKHQSLGKSRKKNCWSAPIQLLPDYQQLSKEHQSP